MTDSTQQHFLDLDARSESDHTPPNAWRTEAADAADRVRDRIHQFTATLLRHLPDTAQVISPASLYFALINLRMGLAGEAKTMADRVLVPPDMSEATFAAGLEHLVTESFDGPISDELTISMNQLLVAQEGQYWRESYLDTVRSLMTDLGTLDFANDPALAAETLNDWADSRTAGMIPEIFESAADIDPATLLMVLNAVYFKGLWQKPFDDEPFEADFQSDSGTTRKPFMKQTGKFFYREADGVQFVDLPYHGGASMQIALGPRETPLADVADALFALDEGELEKREGTVVMPVFRVESDSDLIETLAATGLGHIFRDLGETVFFEDPATLAVSNVRQLIRLEVDRKGTEAAAVTVIPMVRAALLPPDDREPFVMEINRPFAFRIVYRGLPLFGGLITEP